MTETNDKLWAKQNPKAEPAPAAKKAAPAKKATKKK